MKKIKWFIIVAVVATLCWVTFRNYFIVCRLPIRKSASSVAKAKDMKPLSEDEQAALRWLDHIMGPLPPEEEKEWWNIGGRQFGLFSTRYNIAFAGYSAAALGIRGNDEQKAVVARILDNSIKRIIKKEVWAYTQSKSYWGKKPWAPDPCYQENVM